MPEPTKEEIAQKMQELKNMSLDVLVANGIVATIYLGAPVELSAAQKQLGKECLESIGMLLTTARPDITEQHKQRLMDDDIVEAVARFMTLNMRMECVLFSKLCLEKIVAANPAQKS